MPLDFAAPLLYMPAMLQTAPDTRLPFVKMHGLGNDFVIIDSRGRDRRVTPALARTLGDRHRGIGFDQLAELWISDDELQLDFWNWDGTRSAACGNATRCVAALVMQESGAGAVALHTKRGRLLAERGEGGMVRVNMGRPQLAWQAIPLAHEVDIDALPLKGQPSAVGMGNPHCITFVDSVASVDLEREGPRVEHDPLFPERTNVEFVELVGPDLLRTRVWERGTGVTLACGSGACAVAVAAQRRGLAGRRVEVALDGGSLFVEWRDDGVWMTGPTARVFEGVLDASVLAGL